jgi:hypothetical protein
LEVLSDNEKPPDPGNGVDGEERAPGWGARYEITMTKYVEVVQRMNR